MIDLTPIDVRKKAGDFKRGIRGYDPEEVDAFLSLAAERLEELVKENLTLKERVDRLQEQVSAHEGRERAVQEALVVAQQLRADLRAQAEREAELKRKEADAELDRQKAGAERAMERAVLALEELEKRRLRFIRGFRAMLQNELDSLAVEETRVTVSASDLLEAVPAPPEPPPPPESPRAPPSQPRENLAGSSQDQDGEGGLWLSSVLEDQGTTAEDDKPSGD